MDSTTTAPQDRPSSIPRPSRLPRPTVSIPKPATPSSTSPSLRLVSSRDSLGGRVTPVRDLQSPRLRSSISRSSLRSSCSSHHEVKPFVRHCASKEQLRPGGVMAGGCRHNRASIVGVPTAPAVAKPQRAVSASRRWSTITHNPTTQYRPWAEPRPGDPDRDDFVRESTPSEGMPELLLNSYLNGTLGNSRISDYRDSLPSAASDGAFPDLSHIRYKTSMPSLSERTLETLSQIPSSPGVSHRSSTFDHSGHGSVAEGTVSSRPDSSHASEPSSAMSPISHHGPSAKRASFASSRFSSSSHNIFHARCSSPVKRPCGAVHGRTSLGSVSNKKLPKPKSNRSLRNPSLSTLATTDSSEMDGPHSAGWDGSIQPISPAVESDDEPGYRKSSSALRDHIARAKAAKRAAMKLAGGGDDASPVGCETVGISTTTGLDDSVYDDSLDPRTGGNTILKQRVSAARTSGRLNIAALGLEEIPSEVLKMYDYESIQESGGKWAESVDLKRFIAADNDLEKLDEVVFPDQDPEQLEENDDAPANIFGGLEAVDLHGNQLVSVPVGLRRLAHLTSLNLSSNRLDNDCLLVISQITSLRDLKLAKNSLAGPLDASLANLVVLETLDIHANHVSALPSEVQNLARLRILNLSENNFESIPFENLSKLPLTELDLKRNKLSGTLIEGPIESLPHLQTFDVSNNRLTRLVPEGASISLPVVHTLLLSMNRLQELPDMSSWANLLTLTADTNNITVIPDSFSGLAKLRQADFSGNDIRVVPAEIARMDDLTMLRLSGNPLRERKFSSASTDAIKSILAGRLEPSSPCQETANADTLAALADELSGLHLGDGEGEDGNDTSPSEEVPSSPATSAPEPQSPSWDCLSSEPDWQVKTGGLLDLSRRELSTLDEGFCARAASQHSVHYVQLCHNLYKSVPGALSAFAGTLTSLALSHNQMEGETYLTEELSLPSLSELNLASNHIAGMEPLIMFLRAPSLEKIDISMNRLSALPIDLRNKFPTLTVLLASNNHLVELDPASIKGLQVIDVSNNDIAHLDPRIGLLGGQNGLQKLEVTGNRFRVPRWNVLELGTEATMRWLRGRVPAADMAAWKAENGDESMDELD